MMMMLTNFKKFFFSNINYIIIISYLFLFIRELFMNFNLKNKIDFFFAMRLSVFILFLAAVANAGLITEI